MATTLAPIVTPALIATIRRYPNLPRHSWYFVAATTLSIINRPDEITQIYKYALNNGGLDQDQVDSTPNIEEQLAISRRIREAIIKSAAIGGLPKVCLSQFRHLGPSPLVRFNVNQDHQEKRQFPSHGP